MQVARYTGHYSLTSPFVVPTGTTIDARGATFEVLGDIDGVHLQAGSSWVGGEVWSAGPGASDTAAFRLLGDDTTIDGAHVHDWTGDGVRGVDVSWPLIRDSRFHNIKRTGGAGSAVRLIASTTDVVSPVLEGLRIDNCAGSGVQLEGVWKRPDWRTAGAKVLRPRLRNIDAINCGYAGVFLNGCRDGSIVQATAAHNGDYGVGFEFCQSCTADSVTAYDNATHGFAIMQAGDACRISGVARGNVQHGFWLHFGTVVPGDEPTCGCELSGIASDNGGDGFNVVRAVGGVVRGTGLRNGANGAYISSDDVKVDIEARANGGHGVHVRYADRVRVDAQAHGNGGKGIFYEGSGSNKVNGGLVTGAASGNAAGQIDRNADAQTVVVGETFTAA